MQKQFRKEPENNRLLLLGRLAGREANPRYAFRHHAEPAISVSVAATTIEVNLAAQKHPLYNKKVDANCYAYEVALNTWTEVDGLPHTEVPAGSWLALKGPGALFEFAFAIPAGARHWMLCIKLYSGINNEPANLFTADGAFIYKIGSFNAAEQAWLQSLPPVRDEIMPETEVEQAPVAHIPARPLPEAG